MHADNSMDLVRALLLIVNSAIGLICVFVCLRVRAAVAELQVKVLLLLREYVTQQDCRDRRKEKSYQKGG